jgi:hypothetical protein
MSPIAQPPSPANLRASTSPVQSAVLYGADVFTSPVVGEVESANARVRNEALSRIALAAPRIPPRSPEHRDTSFVGQPVEPCLDSAMKDMST